MSYPEQTPDGIERIKHPLADPHQEKTMPYFNFGPDAEEKLFDAAMGHPLVGIGVHALPMVVEALKLRTSATPAEQAHYAEIVDGAPSLVDGMFQIGMSHSLASEIRRFLG